VVAAAVLAACAPAAAQQAPPPDPQQFVAKVNFQPLQGWLRRQNQGKQCGW